MSATPNRRRPRARAAVQSTSDGDGPRGVRLHKALARAGVASRRRCEQLIAQGQVTINRTQVTQLPAWVNPGRDVVRINGRIVDLKHAADPTSGTGELVYIALHKPRGVISTCDDPGGRRSVLDIVEHAGGITGRVYPVGRLDADSTGLMLLTNDGDLAYRLTHPRFGIQKHYHVTVGGRVTDDDLAALSKGVMLAKHDARAHPAPRRTPTRTGAPGRAARATVAAVQRVGRLKGPGATERTKLVITLTEGQNRQIRRMLAKLGHKVGRLKRVAFGPIGLNRLAPGRWRHLERREVIALRRAAGLRA